MSFDVSNWSSFVKPPKGDDAKKVEKMDTESIDEDEDASDSDSNFQLNIFDYNTMSSAPNTQQKSNSTTSKTEKVDEDDEMQEDTSVVKTKEEKRAEKEAKFAERRETENEERGYIGAQLGRIDEAKLAQYEQKKLERLGIKSKQAADMEGYFKVHMSEGVFSNAAVQNMKEDEICDRLKNALQLKMGIEKLTRIQNKTLKPILQGKDVLICSETGSGKTLSYTIPMLQKLYQYSVDTESIQREHGTYAIILAPTRELCIQIESVVKKAAHNIPYLVTGLLIGGEKGKSEKARLRKGVTILIATPGRLNYHLKHTECFKLDHLKFIILDEADGLLELGEEEQIRNMFLAIGPKLVSKENPQTTPQKPQVVLVSATLTKNIRKLADFTLKEEVIVTLTDEEELQEKEEESKKDELDVFQVPKNLVQYYIMAPKYLYLSLLVSLMRARTHPTSLENQMLSKKKKPSKMLVFFASADSVEFYYILFCTKKLFANFHTEEDIPNFSVPILKLHADMSQQERVKSFEEFSKIESGILLTTDVAARGLDFKGVDWIIQYDPPGQPKEYIHRIGRTGRLGTEGNAVLLLSENEILYLKLLEKYNLKINKLNGETLFENLVMAYPEEEKSKNTTAAVARFNSIVNRCVKDDKVLYDWAVASFLTYTRAYTSHYKDTRYIFHTKNLRLDHVKRMYGLSEKATFLLKQKPNVGRILQKLNQKQNMKSDLRPTKEVKEEKKRVNINEYLDTMRADLEGTLRERVPIRLPSDIQKDKTMKHVQEQRNKMKYAISEEDDYGKKTVVGKIEGSGSQMQKFLGETIQGSSKDERKKRKFTEKLRTAVLEKGRTTVAEKMVERNPFDVRQKSNVAALMNSTSSEFDSAIRPAKKRKLQQESEEVERI